MNSLEKDGWVSLNLGFLMALMVYHSPAMSALLYPAVVLVHEFGHAIIGWLFGYPSLPTFDFERGGGITFHGKQNIAILVGVYLNFFLLLFFYRDNFLTFRLLLWSLVGYSLLLVTDFFKLFILLMGHGSELGVASGCLYLAVTRRWVIGMSYAGLGFFIVMYDLTLAYKLMYDPSYQKIYVYQQGNNGDLSRLALQYFDNQLSSVANLLFWSCFLPLLISVAGFYYHDFIYNSLQKLKGRQLTGRVSKLGENC